jgi:hypothetical protein
MENKIHKQIEENEDKIIDSINETINKEFKCIEEYLSIFTSCLKLNNENEYLEGTFNYIYSNDSIDEETIKDNDEKITIELRDIESYYLKNEYKKYFNLIFFDKKDYDNELNHFIFEDNSYEYIRDNSILYNFSLGLECIYPKWDYEDIKLDVFLNKGNPFKKGYEKYLNENNLQMGYDNYIDFRKKEHVYKIKED